MKNPIETLRPGTIRAMYGAAAVVVLFASLVSFYQVMFVRPTGNDQCRWTDVQGDPPKLLITEIVGGGVANKAGLQNGDLLLQIDGQAFTSALHAQTFINAAAGDSVTYLIERRGETYEVRIQVLRAINMTYLALGLYGFGFFVIGLIVVLARPDGKVQRLFARYGMLSLLLATHVAANLNPALDPMWILWLWLGSFAVAGIFGPPIFVRFFLHFPIRLKLADSKLFGALLYLVSLLMTAPLVYEFTTVAQVMPPYLVNMMVFGRFAFVFIGLSFFLYSYIRYVRSDRRHALRPLLWGTASIVVAFAYMVYIAATDPFAAFINPIILLPALIMPLGTFFFGFAIIRYRLMDMNFIIKRSLIYGLVTATIAVIYILTVYMAGNLLSSMVGQQENEVVVIVALIVIAFVFDPVKRSMQEWVDRVFYRERYHYQKTLLGFAQELPRQLKLEQILGSMVQRISVTMHVEGVAVILCDPKQGCVSVEQNIPKACCAFNEDEGGLFHRLQLTHQPQSFHMLSEDPNSVQLNEYDKRLLHDGGIVLSVPMFLQDRFIGAINVGKKRSGSIYTEEDVSLLQTVAAQAAVAIENARLHESELEKEKYKEELSLARNIQEGLLPKEMPSLPGVDFSAVSLPAMTVGGDYFDFIRVTKDRLLVVVADVSGKGMSAALYMSKVQGMIQLAAHMYSSPRQMLIHVNKRIFEAIERRSFITMAVALIDVKAKKVRICRAGHNPVLIGRGKKLEYIKTPGIGLGLEEGHLFDRELREVVLPLNKDSLFLLYTDGLTEAMNEGKEEFGEERVKKLVEKNRGVSARGLQEKILQAVDAYQGPAERHDDLTFVVVKPTDEKVPKKRPRSRKR